MKESTTHHTRRSLACTYCRVKKVRCSGDVPCQNCLDHGQTCIVNPRKRRKTSAKDTGPSVIEKKLSDLENAISALRGDALSGANGEEPLSKPGSVPATASMNEDQVSLAWVAPSANIQASGDLDSNVVLVRELQNSTMAHDLPLQTYAQGSRGEKADPNTIDTESSSIYSSFTLGAEYQGPRTTMSLCSRAGIEWVAQRTKSTDFQASAQLHHLEVALRLKIQKPLSIHRKPEPPITLALDYSRAYFEFSHDAALGVVHQAWFEDKVRIRNQSNNLEDDPAWYALRNAVYASGCRILVNRSMGFQAAQEQAWPFFENALSVQSQVLYWQTTVIGVQAFAVMAYFTEAVSSPLLQYMLCSTGLRLAIAKGLHRRPSPSWNLSSEEQRSRACTFWALYCLEKQVTSRSGRPTALDDSEINCHLPCAYEGLTPFNQIKKLASTEAFQQPIEKLVETVQDLERSIKNLRQSCKEEFGLPLPMDLSSPPEFLTSRQAMCIQSLYYNLVWDIHTPLVYPWYHLTQKAIISSTGKLQIDASTSIVLETSKDAILDSQLVHIDASCPLLSAYIAPLYALVNIFVHALTVGRADTIQSGLVFLQIGIRHFARVRLETASYISTPYIQELHRVLSRFQNTAAANAPRSNKLDRWYTGNVDATHGTAIIESAPSLDSATMPGALNPGTDVDANTELLDMNLGTDFETWYYLQSSTNDFDQYQQHQQNTVPIFS